MYRPRILALLLAYAAVICIVCLWSAETQSPLRRITNTTQEGININPSISGDGRIIGFESTEDVAGAGGTDYFRAIRANISIDPPSFFQMGRTRTVAPAISQDGSRIAFASKDDPLGTNTDGNSEIFLFNGSSLLQVTNTSPGDPGSRIVNGNFQPSISDDGRFVAFSSNRNPASQNSDGNLEIFVFDSVAGTFAQLTNSSGMVGFSDAKISGNGAKVAYIRDAGATPSARRDLMIQDRASGPASVIASQILSLRVTYGRAISDDGTRVAYSAETATNTTQVFFYDGRSGNINRQVTTLGARATEVPLHPTMSGDGKRLAFATRRAVTGFTNSDASVELYTYDIPTNTFARITSATSEADCFDGSNPACEVVSSLNDEGTTVAFNFPRSLSGGVSPGLENRSEIYATGTVVRPPFGTLSAILNHASFGHEPLPIKAVAPDSIAVALGSALANTTQQSQPMANGNFPTNVGGTTVTVNGRPTQVFFVSPNQVQFLVPPETELGTAEVVVTNADGFASRGNVTTFRAAPGIFTKTGDGVGEGMILNSDTLQEGPFDPGGGNLRLLIFTTGARNAISTTVNIGDRVVNAESVISSPDMPGLDEVRVIVPSDLRGVGTVTLSIRSDFLDSNPVTVSFLGDPSRNVLINEVLADPPDGIAGDANHDGVRDGTDDEFVELVNATTGELINIGGWTIKTRPTGSSTETTRFTFASGTSLPAGEAIVVFGGGSFNSSDPIFGCAQVVKATTSAGLSLTNGGLTILVRDANGNQITTFTYGGSSGLEGDNNQSLTRSPDITGAFVQHMAAAGANGRRYSPGLKVNGTPFGNCPAILTTVTISPPAATIGVGQVQQFTAQAFDQYGRVMTGVNISFASDSTGVATVDSTSFDSGTGIATANVTGRNPGTAHITASATDGTTTVNSSQATLTVTGPSLTITDVSQNEGDAGTTTFTFTVSLSAVATAPVTFDIATQDNTATVANSDYVARSLTSQTIAAGQQNYTFDVTVNGDTNNEQSETFFVNVTNVSGASVGDSQGLGTIVTDDIPLISINDVSQVEGNSGTTTFTFTITSNRIAPAGGITFDISTADGTAQDDNPASEDNDYVANSTTAKTIPAGLTQTTFDVTVNGDTVVETNETFFVNITNISANASGSDTQGLGTIENDDFANLVVSQVYPGGGLSGATFTHDFVELFNRGTSTIDFTLTPYSVQFLSTGGSTWAKTDLTSGTIAPGSYFLVRETSGGANGAALPPPDATGSINLTSTTPGKIALVVGTTLLVGSCPGDDASVPFNPVDGTIADFVGYSGTAATGNHCYEGSGPAAFTSGSNTTADFRKSGGCVDTNDNAADFVVATPNPRNSGSPANDCSTGFRPDITINDVAVSEGNGGTSIATFTVSLSAANATQTVTVNFATADGTALAGSDYQSNSGTVTFVPGDTSEPVSITINGDLDLESTENFFVNLSNPVNAAILDGQGVGTINEDDSPPTLTINDVSINEGNSSTTTFQFAVSLSAPALTGGVTFDIATQDSTATVADNDYVSKSLTGQTIPAGQQTYTFDVTVNGDVSQEANESFFVNVTNVSGATVADGQGTGTIQDDDAPPTLSILDVTQAETNSSTTTFNFTVQLSSSAQAGGVNFTIDTADGTTNPATAGNDYDAIVNGSGSIAQGNTSTTVSVTINGDTVFEPNETFFVNVSNVTGATVTDGQALGTITNDDAQPAITISDASLTEGNAGTSSMTFTVTLSGSSQSSITVNYATADSSATLADADYADSTGMVTFVPGDTSETLSVTINGDTSVEGDEMFLVNLSGASGATISDNQALGTVFLDDAFSIAAVNTAYAENFDVLSQTGNSSTTPAAWTRAETGSSVNTTYTANNGSSTTGDTYSYGTTGSSDRALGGLRTGSLVPTLGSFYRNDTGSTLNTLQISYTGEEWRLGNAGRTDRIDFQYSINATNLTAGTWTDVDLLDFTTPNTTTTGSKDGNNASNRTAISHTITGVSIAPGATFWIRWTDFDATGSDDGLAVDDFSIAAGVDTPALSINDVTQAETNGGTTSFNFTVQLTSPAPPGGVSFTINTADGTTDPANAGSDYVAIVNGSGSIPQNGTSTTVTVTVNGDTDVEPNETFFVNLSGVSGATVTDGQGLGTITNDDAVAGSADLSITKTDSPDPVAIGNDITYTITVTNNGPDVSDNVTLSDTVPTDTTFRSINAPAGWTCPTQPAVGGTGAISCTNSSFGVGSAVFTLVVRVGTAVADSTIITNTASVSSSTSDPNSGNESAMQTTTVKQPLLVISQIYPGGGNTGATYTNDFIEVFNRGTTTVDFAVAPYSVQYTSQAGNFGGATAAVKTDITSGTLAPGQYFLIRGASGGANGIALPTPDVLGSIAMAASAGKVALVLGTSVLPVDDCPGDDNVSPFNPNNAVIVDFVGYGGTAASTTCYEGSGPAPFSTSTAGGLDPDARSTIRTNSCTDTNVNSADFSNPTTAPVARNTATAPTVCP